MPHKTIAIHLTAGLRLSNARYGGGGASNTFILPPPEGTYSTVLSDDYTALRPLALDLAKRAFPILADKEKALAGKDAIVGACVYMALGRDVRAPSGWRQYNHYHLFTLEELGLAQAEAA